MPSSSRPTFSIASVDRIARVNELLKQEIAEYIEKNGLNEGGCLISVTKVNCSSSLQNASVYVSLLGASDEEQENAVLKKLMKHRSEMQRVMSKRVILKYTPVLRFYIDRNIEAGDRVLDIIRGLEENENI